MKKFLSILLLFVLLLSFSVPALAADEKETSVYIMIPARITFDDGETTWTYEVRKGEKIQDPPKARDIEGYTFAGWYDGDREWDFENDVVTGHMTLVAKYQQNAQPPRRREPHESGERIILHGKDAELKPGTEIDEDNPDTGAETDILSAVLLLTAASAFGIAVTKKKSDRS